MNTRFLFPILALIAAVLACDMPQLSGGKYPMIQSLTVTRPSGVGNFTATVTLSPHTKLGYLVCYAIWERTEAEAEDENGDEAGELVYGREALPPTKAEVTISFDFWPSHGGGNELLCVVEDINKDPIHDESTLFSFLEPTETPTETPMARTATLTFSDVSDEYMGMLPGCWEADGTVKQIVMAADGTLQVECGWDSPLDFTIRAALTGKWNKLTPSVTFHLEQTVTYKYPGGITGTIVVVWDGEGAPTSLTEANGTATSTWDCNLPPQPEGLPADQGWLACAKDPVTEQMIYSLKKTGTASWRMVINP
ncbi:MAG: hypothetical protein AB1345_07020 [Chloroflexota bacterium]